MKLLLLAVVVAAMIPAAFLPGAHAQQTVANTTYATTELVVFSNGLPVGEKVGLTTVFTAEGDDYGYVLGTSELTVKPSGNMTRTVEFSDLKGGEDEPGVVHGWFYLSTDEYENIYTPVTKADGQPAEFTLTVP